MERKYMKLVEPTVTLICRPQLDTQAIENYLEEIGAKDRPPGVVDLSHQYEAESLVEFSGRLDYNSFKPKLNPNVTRIRTSIEEYIQNILNSHHGSVCEGGFFVFILHNVSRVLTAELCRHRVGTSFSERSLRYVRLEDISMWLPEWAKRDEDLLNRCVYLVSQIESHQRWMAEHFQLDAIKDFSEKKDKTSFMRRFAPLGLATDIVFGSNVRQLRHMIELRTSIHAEAEIRKVFQMIAEIMCFEAPNLFGDFTQDEQGQWIPRNSKI